ncbi:MAG: complex I 51 kDa subunit family protein [bacterium]
MEERKFLTAVEIKDLDKYNFSALKRALNISPEKTIKEIKESKLKGRGGAGFPTGLKWELALKEDSEQKYMICNGDEGEPGTFKDRYLMENNPLKVLEGIIIAAYTIGAEQGYIYIRGEYTKSIKVFEKLIKESREKGILGENIFNSNFNFDLKLVKGAGAYVCGDETSLINSIEGLRGNSRIKPPYPIEKGLFDQPTVVNNIETLSCAAEIIKQGAEVFTQMGTENSRGTKLVCLSGDINEPGLYEVEFGQGSIKEIIDEFGQGIKKGKQLKFVIPGGISTSILRKDQLDVDFTYEDIEKEGSGLGSGAIIVVSESRNLLDLMLNVSRFFMDETCGTCFPCREGNRQINRILKEAENGFTKRQKNLIEDIGETIRLAARCGLGQTSLNFIKSIFDNYQEELMIGRGKA